MRIPRLVRLLSGILRALIDVAYGTIAQPAGKTARVGWIAIGPERGRARAFRIYPAGASEVVRAHQRNEALGR